MRRQIQEWIESKVQNLAPILFLKIFCKPKDGSKYKTKTIQTWLVTQSVSSVQSLSRVWLFATPWIAAHQASLSITNSQSLLKLMSIESVIPSSHLILLSFPSPPAPNPCQHQGLFQWVSSSHKWPKYWSFSFSISPSNEYSGMISFRIHWFDLLAFQGTLKSLLKHRSSKASIL